MDVCLGRHPWTDYDINALGNVLDKEDNIHVKIFSAFLENDGFRNYFLNRHQDIFNTILEPNFLESALDELVDKLRPEMESHFDQWSDNDFENWESQRVEKIRNYISKRPEYSRNFLLDYFNLPNAFELTIPATENGQVNLNSLLGITDDFSGFYFCGNNIKLSVIPDAGYFFSHWKITANNHVTESYQYDLNISFCDDTKVSAIFKPISGANPFILAFEPTSKVISVHALIEQTSDQLFMSIYSVEGRLIGRIDIPKTVGFYEFNANIDIKGNYLLIVENENEVLQSKKITVVE